jgi:hypothetical protein
VEALGKLEKDRIMARKICAALNAAGVIEPWPVQFEFNGESLSLAGLFRISETKLNALDPEVFAGLRVDGTLLVAYCQMISMQHLSRLANRVIGKGGKDNAPFSQVAGKSGFDPGGEHGTLSFENL